MMHDMTLGSAKLRNLRKANLALNKQFQGLKELSVTRRNNNLNREKPSYGTEECYGTDEI